MIVSYRRSRSCPAASDGRVEAGPRFARTASAAYWPKESPTGHGSGRHRPCLPLSRSRVRHGSRRSPSAAAARRRPRGHAVRRELPPSRLDQQGADRSGGRPATLGRSADGALLAHEGQSFRLDRYLFDPDMAPFASRQPGRTAADGAAVMRRLCRLSQAPLPGQPPHRHSRTLGYTSRALTLTQLPEMAFDHPSIGPRSLTSPSPGSI